MTRLLVCAALVAVVGVAAAQEKDVNELQASKESAAPAQDTGWRVVEAEAFTVPMPGPAAKSQGDVPSPFGNLQLHTWTVELDEAAVIVGLTDYPADKVSDASPAKILEAVRDGAVRSGQGTLVKDRVISIEAPAPKAKWPGREFEATLASGFRVRSRIYLVANRLYQLVIVTRGEGGAELFERVAQGFRLQPVK